MTLPIERARTRKPVTWLTVVGVILLPVLIGGLLVAALYNPVERLDNMSAAIVNDDEAVEINGQLAPLGRQLTAGLVEGSDEIPSNLDWVISNDEDAAAGIADGTYDAVVTIPEGFSAAATSTAPGGTPTRATIEVQTSPDSLVVDDAITAQITQAAASLMGSQLSTVYLENVFLGFTTLGDQLGDAADGARQLADGGREAADGATQLADGATEAAGGAEQLADGAAQASSGATELAGGVRQLSGGAGQLAAGASATSAGLTEWAAGARDVAGGTAALATGLSDAVADIGALPEVPPQLIEGADYLAENTGRINGVVRDAAADLSDLAANCATQGGSAEVCAALTDLSTRTQESLPEITTVIDQSGAIAGQVAGIAEAAPTAIAGLQQAADAAAALSGGMNELADGADSLSAGGAQLAQGASTLAAGATAAADGADELSGGIGLVADGAGTLAGGIGELGDGATSLADGVGQVADGTGTLADGLDTATEALPSYTDAQATDLASVVAAPVEASGLDTNLFGASAVPLLAGLALWLGAIGSFVALQARPRDALSSRKPSFRLALRSFAPAAVIGAVQGVLVAAVVQLAATYDPSTWVAFAGMSVLAGVSFAAINQALVAVFGGAGRWIAAGVAALAVATGVVSTVPGVLSDIAGLLPTASAYQGMLAALTSADGGGAAIAGLIIWALLSLMVTVVVTARARTTSARAVLRPAAA